MWRSSFLVNLQACRLFKPPHAPPMYWLNLMGAPIRFWRATPPPPTAPTMFSTPVRSSVLFEFLFLKSRGSRYRRRRPEVFLIKGVLKICSKFTGEHPCRSVISIKLHWHHTLAWVFSCKFVAYFQNTFS